MSLLFNDASFAVLLTISFIYDCLPIKCLRYCKSCIRTEYYLNKLKYKASNIVIMRPQLGIQNLFIVSAKKISGKIIKSIGTRSSLDEQLKKKKEKEKRGKTQTFRFIEISLNLPYCMPYTIN